MPIQPIITSFNPYFKLVPVEFEAVAIPCELDYLDEMLFLGRIRSYKNLFQRRNTASSL